MPVQELTDGAIWSESNHVPERFAVEGMAEGIMDDWLVPEPEQAASRQQARSANVQCFMAVSPRLLRGAIMHALHMTVEALGCRANKP